MTSSETIAKMFQIRTKAAEDIREAMDQYNLEHATDISVERLCYDAMLENQRNHSLTPDLLPRTVFGYSFAAYPVDEWMENCSYYRAKDREAREKEQNHDPK